MRFSSLLACSLGLLAAIPAQSHPDRAYAREHAAVVAASPHVFGDRLCVKLAEGTGAQLRDGTLVSRTGADLAAVAALFASAQAEPLFTALSWEELDAWHARACAALPPRDRPGHLGLWFRLVLPSSAAADAMTEALFGCEQVAYVHKEPKPTPASHVSPRPDDILPPTPSFTSMQTSHGPSPLGYGVWRGQGVYGARGQGVRLCMVESEWHLDHEDCSKLVAANFVGPVPPALTNEANHGIAGASIFCADRNAYGMTGIADEAEARFVSQLTNGGVANAILLAGVHSQPGDVHLLVFMFLLGQLGLTDWVPIEFLQAAYDATRTVTGNGRIQVCTGANGGNSLDDPRFARRFDRGFRDSGAIMIAATVGGTLSRANFSNFGSRIDGNGWGDSTVTCGIGSLFLPNGDLRQAYSASYAGTSSAVPAVAGIVAALQGAARAQLGRDLATAEILQLLRTHGPLSPDGIGRRPDLVGMLQTLGALDGLEVGWPDVPLGGAVGVNLQAAAGSFGFLFTSLTPGSTDFGLNRRVLLGLPTLQTIGFFPMPGGTAAWQLQVPNDVGLRGASLYFQAGLLQGSAPIHVTNSAQVTIL